MSTLQIDGLSKRQRAIADVLWSLETPAEVQNFIDSLPDEQQQEARTVMNMMIWAMLDTVNETALAAAILHRYRL